MKGNHYQNCIVTLVIGIIFLPQAFEEKKPGSNKAPNALIA